MTCRKLLQLFVLPALLFISQLLFAQDRVITGRVTDANGNGVPGVTVTPKGGGTPTQTSSDGTYRITVKSTTTALVFSSVGYGTQEMLIRGNSVDASLNVTNTNMNEVVVIGYGTRLKKDLTGSVTNLTTKDFNKGAITTPEQLISGRVAGVQIISNGGAPGSGSTIRIRGGASLNASNEPLIVIDGIPMEPLRNPSGLPTISGSPDPLSLINPNDIESITVLKDAAATAIYGSRASNGVIIITTKKGRSGKPRFTFSTQQTVSTLSKKADVLTADQLRTYVRAHGTPAQIALLGSANTDWQDMIYRDASGNDNNLSMSGTFKNVLPYRISVGILGQNGILKTGSFKRKSAGVNLSPQFFKNHLRLDLGWKGSLTNSRFADEGAISAAVNFDPTQFVHSGNKRYGGYFEWLDPASSTGLRQLAPRNPLGILEQKLDISKVTRHILTAAVDYKLHFFPDLHLKANLGYDISNGRGSVFVNDSAASSYGGFTDPTTGLVHNGLDREYRQTRTNRVFEPFVNYLKDIASINSKIDFIAGYSYQDYVIKTFNFTERTPDGTLKFAPTFPFDKFKHDLISYYGRLNYTFHDKYILTGSIRRDGSSRFAKDNRWGWFPAGAIAWKMKDEDFLASSRTISDLKLRLSYGETGQQEFDYGYLALYTVGNINAQYQFGNSFYDVYRPDGYNPNLQWEQTATYNGGIDYGFLDNRITGSVDVYFKKTTKLLSTVDQPAGTNFSNKITANVGDMENKGVEFSINTQPVKNKSTTWDLGFNFTYNQNKITRLTFIKDPNFVGNHVGGISGGVGNTIEIQSVGFPNGSFFVFQQVYDPNTGKPIEGLFVDRNGDGIVDALDMYHYKSANPKMLFGAYSNVNWRKWNGGFSMRASVGNYNYNNRFSSTGVKRNIINPLNYLNNGSTNVLETDFAGNGDRYFLSDYYVQNASFLRMDNIYVGFNAGDFLARNTTLRINGNVQNVFLVTKYKGVDPEINGGIDNNFYPRPRIFVVTLNLDF